MATKRTKSEEPAAPPVKPAPKRKVASRPGLTKPKTAAPSKAAKAAEPAKAVKPKAAKPKPSPVELSTELIALRAYFISEARQASGIPGNETTDWLEAEKQLRAELGA